MNPLSISQISPPSVESIQIMTATMNTPTTTISAAVSSLSPTPTITAEPKHFAIYQVFTNIMHAYFPTPQSSDHHASILSTKQDSAWSSFHVLAILVFAILLSVAVGYFDTESTRSWFKPIKESKSEEAEEEKEVEEEQPFSPLTATNLHPDIITRLETITARLDKILLHKTNSRTSSVQTDPSFALESVSGSGFEGSGRTPEDFISELRDLNTTYIQMYFATEKNFKTLMKEHGELVEKFEELERENREMKRRLEGGDVPPLTPPLIEGGNLEGKEAATQTAVVGIERGGEENESVSSDEDEF